MVSQRGMVLYSVGEVRRLTLPKPHLYTCQVRKNHVLVLQL